MRHLLAAMRDTVPDSGLLEAAPGQEMFTSMLDDHIADRAAERSTRGLGDALYHQLSRRLPGADPAAGA